MNHVFIGMDTRQPLAYYTAQHSLVKNATTPVAVTPLAFHAMPTDNRGLTEFTYSRYLVPHLTGYQGYGLFIDSDMLVTGDVTELFAAVRQAEERHPVWVVPKQGKLKFEEPAVMLFDCELCADLTLDWVESKQGVDVGWAASVGALPQDWHFLVGYEEHDPKAMAPALLHFTQGLPCFPETASSPYKHLWEQYADEVSFTVPWVNLMGQSVHAVQWPSGIKTALIEAKANLRGGVVNGG